MSLSILQFALYLFAASLIGSLLTILAYYVNNKKNIFSIKRFYPYLPQARDVYNQISFQFDKQFNDFKLCSIKLYLDKKHNAYVIDVKYKSLNGKRFSF